MKKLTLLIFTLGFCALQLVHAQNEKFKALFMYNFTKYIEWPASVRQGDFVIGVLGNSSLTKELETIASKQKVGSQAIVVKVFNDVKDIDNCHILYISPGKSSVINSAVDKLNGKSTLIISDKNGLALQGAGINYVSDGDKIKYEINKKNIDKHGLTVNSALLALGVVVSN
jgi:hypothetical protein